MAQELALFDQRPQLPAELASFFEEEANIQPKQTVPTLSYEGKVWTIGLEGEKKKLMGKNQEGDEQPLAVMRVVVLAWNKQRGRAFYEGAYDPAKVAMPKCWSDDGIVPAESCKEKESPKCATCPQSAKGSKVTDQGNSTVACSEHRMIVVVPAQRLNFEPLRLKLAITSDFDGRSPEHEAQGWYAFKNYTEMLCSKGVQHTAQMVTKMKFDPNKAFPKVLFAADRWLTPEQTAEIVPIVKSEKVVQLVSGIWTPNGIDGTRSDEPKEPFETEQMRQQVAAEVAAEAKKVAAAKVAAAAASDGDEGEVDLDLGGGAPATTTAAPPKATAAATAMAAAAAKAAAAAATKAAPKAAAAEPAPATDAGLKDLLSEWA